MHPATLAPLELNTPSVGSLVVQHVGVAEVGVAAVGVAVVGVAGS